MSIKNYLLRNELLDKDITKILLLSVKAITVFTGFSFLSNPCPK